MELAWSNKGGVQQSWKHITNTWSLSQSSEGAIY